MSTSNPETTPGENESDPILAPAAEPDRVQGGLGSSPWVWMTLACLLLGTSAGVRAWQDHRFSTLKNAVAVAPFPLKQLPWTLGEWQAQDGSEVVLDPEVARIAGCSDHVVRTYTHAATGQNLSVLILFGPAQAVYGHRPEVCYPAAGYQSVAETLNRSIALNSGPSAEFLSQVYTRQNDPQKVLQEVYFSFRTGDRWVTDPENYWRQFRHEPSMFKIQIQRIVGASERREVANPTEQFLAKLLPEIERRIAQSAKNPGETKPVASAESRGA